MKHTFFYSLSAALSVYANTQRASSRSIRSSSSLISNPIELQAPTCRPTTVYVTTTVYEDDNSVPTGAIASAQRPASFGMGSGRSSYSALPSASQVGDSYYPSRVDWSLTLSSAFAPPNYASASIPGDFSKDTGSGGDSNHDGSASSSAPCPDATAISGCGDAIDGMSGGDSQDSPSMLATGPYSDSSHGPSASLPTGYSGHVGGSSDHALWPSASVASAVEGRYGSDSFGSRPHSASDSGSHGNGGQYGSSSQAATSVGSLPWYGSGETPSSSSGSGPHVSVPTGSHIMSSRASDRPSYLTVSSASYSSHRPSMGPYSYTPGSNSSISTNSTSSTTRASASSSSTASTSAAATACSGNSPDDRQQWCDYDINTNYYTIVPDTNVMREYWLTIEQSVAAPDGVSRYVQTVNGTSPGPTIWANWGDWVIIHVQNNMPEASRNGTTMHWHGIRQNYTNQADGVSSVTQCPIVPGDSYTYKWRATQYGSSWYHSHWGLQAWEGVFGGIVIHGPASANYDVDLGNLFLSDWDHTQADVMYAAAALGAPLTYDTGLINGTMVWDDGNTTVGKYFETSFESGKSYLLRLVNVAIDSGFKFMIDGHTLTVIAADFVPIEPYTAEYVQLTMGQRYDVIVTADAGSTANEFWMRSIPQSACSDNANQNNILGIVRYTDSDALPTSSPYTFTDECVDETQLVPIVQKVVGGADLTFEEPASVVFNAQNFVQWTLSGTSYLVHWDDPTLLDVDQGIVSETSTTTNLITLPNAGEWVYVVVENGFVPITHPIHLHGHDFFVIATGDSAFDATTVSYNLNNPPRRDVVLLPISGYVVLAFQTDNPGAWLMHCHIGWHTMEGFALQFLEMESEIHSLGLIDSAVLDNTCSAWDTYAEAWDPVQGEGGLDDSGI